MMYRFSTKYSENDPTKFGKGTPTG